METPGTSALSACLNLYISLPPALRAQAACASCSPISKIHCNIPPLSRRHSEQESGCAVSVCFMLIFSSLTFRIDHGLSQTHPPAEKEMHHLQWLGSSKKNAFTLKTTASQMQQTII